MKISWQVTGSPNIFKLTPPWRAEDDTKEAGVIMVVANEAEDTVAIQNAETGEVLLEGIPVDVLDYGKILLDLGWPVAGTADSYYTAQGLRFIFTCEETA